MSTWAQLPLNINLKLGKAEHQPQDLPSAALEVLHASQEQPEEQEVRSGLSQDLENAQKSQEPGMSQYCLLTEELGPQLGSCEKGIPCISP